MNISFPWNLKGIFIKANSVTVFAAVQDEIPPSGAGTYGRRHRVTGSEAILALLQQCLDTPGVHVVEGPIDDADNDRILDKDVRELSTALPV